MLIEKIANHAAAFWDEYFNLVSKQDILSEKESYILYLNIILISSFNEYVTIELIGGSKIYSGLKKILRRDCGDIFSYFNHFGSRESGAILELDGEDISLSGLCFGHDVDMEQAAQRFPYLTGARSRFVRPGVKGSLVNFTDKFRSATFQICDFVSGDGNFIRSKSYLLLSIIKKPIKSLELTSHFKYVAFKDNDLYRPEGHIIAGVHTVNDHSVNPVIASHLQTLALSEKIHETTLGEYLNQHADILMKAFSAGRMFYEPSLQWMQHDGSVEEKNINPDFIFEGIDGKMGILDLKLAKINKSNLTVNERSRRKFGADIQDGIAQLANYLFYFSFEANRNFFESKYNIDSTNIKLILVIGSIENVVRTSVLESLRSHPGLDIEIIDYDTLVSLFLMSNAP